MSGFERCGRCGCVNGHLTDCPDRAGARPVAPTSRAALETYAHVAERVLASPGSSELERQLARMVTILTSHATDLRGDVAHLAKELQSAHR